MDFYTLLSIGNGVPLVTYKSLVRLPHIQLSYTFSERITYESRGLPVQLTTLWTSKRNVLQPASIDSVGIPSVPGDFGIHFSCKYYGMQ
jgi:hypothetical protein